MPDDMEETGADVSDHMSDNEDESESFLRDDSKMGDNDGEVKKKYDPKDPLRPRRKKARRACYACQRAHLTCGDERPCKRCIKRGLADACQDGVRKKAKYLHDAPEEALGPVLGPNFNATRTRQNGQRQDSGQSDTMSTPATGSNFLTQGTAAPFPVYSAGSQPQVAMDGITFNPQASPVSPSFQANNAPQMDNMLTGNTMDFNALFDPSNPALYNFDLEGLNFGSQYAGWEFGILNKMALGAETPPRENSMSQTPSTEANYAAMFGNGAGTGYDTMMGSDYSGMDSGPNTYTQGNLQHGLPHAYAIAAGPNSLASPSTDATASPQATMEASPGTSAFGGLPGVSVASKMKSKQDKLTQTILGKRQRDSAAVYASVKEPYPYTAGFHNMISVIKDRLPLNKLLLIAKSLGEIRPSFISCTKDLTREDLVFMEKCFQRTLVEFDDFLQHCCAPTIVCRRSGEVAAVNKEFTALTGWTKEVLLGKEPNRNVFVRPASNGGSVDGDSGSRTGDSTPRTKELTDNRSHPVFLAELLDDDSVVQFYRDFAQLAFEDSRGKVQRSCSLMKYRTQEDLDGKNGTSRKDPRTGILSSRVTRIDGEHGISRIERDGKVNCTYCWTIKRDVFDIPMMIIMNFLPRYYPNQEPHQLAV
ncbi:Transcriptional regulator of nonfermentable carbon utilization [Purpureocillium takamizusanense]|uniref:Transcriptional regulator of nonfermentable carbon utilization n=1 Tax=Purpureocillium takamizusanense TaxID=2060973 RepID=A0A9Q8QQD1_9HYPO|nr:Transcriptional regulator of nonfermentable carbon utilization [Purpureocillium takamizusanense]UNI22582.1 Transcriptional regulator of nonfermentable carbon utilization [Purpureocillium takamizusanense]